MKEIFTKSGILMLYFYVLKCLFFLDTDLKIFYNGIGKWRMYYKNKGTNLKINEKN